MSRANVVHVIGTGTIGEPLIGMLADHRKELGIDEVTFHKRTPLTTDRSKVVSLLRRGAQLVTDSDRKDTFNEMGMEVTYETEEAIERSTVVIDCTPKGVGHANKAKYYEKYATNTTGFIAQGSEFGFGKMYARGINDDQMTADDQFVQVVSCNTHNIAVLLQALALENGTGAPDAVKEASFLCMRRSNDVSQDDKYLPSPQISTHDDEKFGTHHARDVWHLYQTKGYDMNLWSSAIKLPTQYMHAIFFDLRFAKPTSMEALEQGVADNRYVATTHKSTANSVFSFGRDHGYYGRILNQTVIPMKSLYLSQDGTRLAGYCFTPQDGNSLLSSIAATLRFLDPDEVDERLAIYDRWLYKEV